MEKLSPKDKEWLKTFTREYYNSAKTMKIHSKKAKKSIYNQDDSRRRCVPLQKCQRLTPSVTPASESPEDELIDYIDSKK